MSKKNLAFGLKRSALAVALGVCFAGGVSAQSNITGSIFGQAPGAAGATVVVENLDSGLTRTIAVDGEGRYRLTSLPNGRYKVTLQRDGQAVSVRDNITVNIASGTEVSFGAPAGDGTTTLGAVTVVGGLVPVIDISQTDTRTVLTAEQLSKVAIGRTVTDVALLAPSVVRSDSYSGVPSFGGSAASENAYFINGYNVTNPLTSVGFSSLAFDSIAEQQILTGGYGAEFGRSTGGVINVVTKRGGNEWKGGIYTFIIPEATRAAPRDLYYADTGFYPVTGQAFIPGPNGGRYVDASTRTADQRTDGTLSQYRDQNLSWTTILGGYVSGPLIKDRLFMYVNGEQERREGTEVLSTRVSTGATANQGWREFTFKLPKWTAKVDWNINDDHVVEFTAVQDRNQTDSSRYSFDYNTFTHGTALTAHSTADNNARLYIGKYTGYLTDNLTVSALYGRQKITHNDITDGIDPNCPQIVAATQNRAPGLTYPAGCQISTSTAYPITQPFEETDGWRLDVTYQLGDHEIRVGYEKQNAEASVHNGMAGGVRYTYGKTATANTAVDTSLGVGSPGSANGGALGAQGYFVQKQFRQANADPSVEQSSQYIEDRWQVSDTFLLSLGLRNEQFTNFDGLGRPYISQRRQLDPRIGFSWDARGDSTFKVFGNIGRYHLATPNQAAIRGAAASLNASEYYTYTGVDATTGAPTGLTLIPLIANNPVQCPGTNLVSSNLECNTAPDPLTTTAKNLKSHYQDEYIAGFEHAFSDAFAWGFKATYRDLRSAIDDVCGVLLRGKCLNANPGETNTFIFKEANGTYTEVTYTAEQLGFPPLKRKYYAFDFFAEHPFGDKWYGKAEYTFSRNWGNTEGQLASDLDTGAGGQADVGRTQDWDLPQLMVGANGLLPNHRKHQFKAFGYYQWTEEWRTGATVISASGRPRNCTSHYPTADAGLYSGAAYWFCGLAGSGTSPTLANGQPNPAYAAPSADFGISPRGSHGTTPWSVQLNLNVAYEPRWADGKLTLGADIINVLNRQTPGAYNPRYETATRNQPNQFYNQEIQTAAPRYIRFMARYDF
jgi:outer membrane receptor protein involved in Fe transport